MNRIERLVGPCWPPTAKLCINGTGLGQALLFEGLLVGAVGGPQPGRGGRVGVGDFGEPDPQEVVVLVIAAVGDEEPLHPTAVGQVFSSPHRQPRVVLRMC